MSIEISYKTLALDAFRSGVIKIAQNDKWSEPKRAYNAARLIDLIQIELKTFNDLRLKYMKKVTAERPEDPKSPEALEKAKELREEAEKFGEVTVTIERYKVDFTDIEHLPLTPAEILAIEPILENLPE